MDWKVFVRFLKAWELWKRVCATPDRLEVLERRVAELEAASGRPHVSCKACGGSSLSVRREINHVGIPYSLRVCTDCGHEECVG